MLANTAHGVKLSRIRGAVALAFAIWMSASCARPATSASSPDATPRPSTADDIDARLAMVAAIHGGTGPWAVAGFRMKKPQDEAPVGIFACLVVGGKLRGRPSASFVLS
jgi:hypothetical protein